MLELKLRPPPSRVGLIERPRVLDQIDRAQDLPVTSIIAPPGYGKTTTLAQYQDTLRGPYAWLTVDESDSDPVVLMTNLADALVSAELLEYSDELRRVGSESVLTKGVNLLAAGLHDAPRAVLFLDQVDHLSTQSALDVVGAVMSKLAGPLRVVVASRTDTGLPLPRLRSQGLVAELTEEHLAMDEEEATEVLEAVGVDPADVIEPVMRTTEGWPVGVYLTAMAIKAGARSPAELEIHGDDFFLADYLKEELLDKTSPSVRSFLVRSSILTRLSGPLCDYVLQTEDSAETLAWLKDANLLIVPMDRTRTWYRYHSLLRDHLFSEISSLQPEQVASLHSRAAAWFEDRGDLVMAIDHLQHADEGDRFAEMVLQEGRSVYAAGQMERLSAWLSWLEEAKTIQEHPELAAFGAYARAMEGDAGASERLGVYAFLDSEGRPRDDSDLGPLARLVRASQFPSGAEQALADARAARAAFGTSTEWFHVCLGMEATAVMAIDGYEAGDAVWADAQWRAESTGAHPAMSWIAAERAIAAIERGDWDVAATFSEQAMRVMRDGGLERYIGSTLVLTAASRLAAHGGNPDEARGLLSQVSASRPRLSVALPVLSLQSLLEMAKAYIEIADVGGARRLVRDAADILAVRPRLGLFVDQYEQLKEKVTSLPAGLVGPSSLTKAELRLLPLLVTHLTYPEIGDRLYISRHTVKTQAMSIYRKLGVSSRADAVEAAREIGLLSV